MILESNSSSPLPGHSVTPYFSCGTYDADSPTQRAFFIRGHIVWGVLGHVIMNAGNNSTRWLPKSSDRIKKGVRAAVLSEPQRDGE